MYILFRWCLRDALQIPTSNISHPSFPSQTSHPHPCMIRVTHHIATVTGNGTFSAGDEGVGHCQSCRHTIGASPVGASRLQMHVADLCSRSYMGMPCYRNHLRLRPGLTKIQTCRQHDGGIRHAGTGL